MGSEVSGDPVGDLQDQMFYVFVCMPGRQSGKDFRLFSVNAVCVDPCFWLVVSNTVSLRIAYAYCLYIVH